MHNVGGCHDDIFKRMLQRQPKALCDACSMYYMLQSFVVGLSASRSVYLHTIQRWWLYSTRLEGPHIDVVVCLHKLKHISAHFAEAVALLHNIGGSTG